MANFIQIALLFSSIAFWFTDAYMGIRHRRNKMLQDESNSLLNEPTSVEKTLVENSESVWFYPQVGTNENENVLYSNKMNEFSINKPYIDIENTHDEETVVNLTINESEKSSAENMEDIYEKTADIKISTNDENHAFEEMDEIHEKTVVKREIQNEETTTENSWAELFISASKLAQPYMPQKITNLNLDWEQLEVAVRSFSLVTTSDVSGRSSLNDSPLMATIRATTAAATPLIMDGVRSLLGMLLDFVDNAGFVTNGHAISRRGVSNSVLDEIMDAFTAILEHMTGAKNYHDIGGL